MKVCSWNIRGKGDRGYLFKLRYINKVVEPEILFVAETRDSKGKIKESARIGPFDGCYSINANGRAGGIALFWKSR